MNLIVNSLKGISSSFLIVYTSTSASFNSLT